MAQTVVGLFDSVQEAENVVRDLEAKGGFSNSDISIVANDSSGERSGRMNSSDKMDNNTAEKAGSGAVAGTATGAGLGILAGLAVLAIPGIGPIVAAGPLVAALGTGAATVGAATALGAGIGAVSGALVGPMVEAGIPRPDAEAYSEGVRRGGTLVVVRAYEAGEAETAANIMSRYNVVDIDSRVSDYQSSGWTHNDNAEPYTTDQISTFRSSYSSQPDMASANSTRRTMDTNTTTNRTGTGDDTLEVIEEDLQIDKRAVEGGGVRVRTFVTERPVEEQVSLREERVEVDRHPVDRDLGDATAAFEERTIEMTETSEEAVVAKRARVVEEVAIRKDVGERTETVRDTVRRQDVDIEQLGNGTTQSDVTTTGMTTERAVGGAEFSNYDTDFRNHYQTTYASTGMNYDSYGPVYRYGYNLAGDDRYRDADWSTVESDARNRWEERNPGTWEQFKDGVHYAWDRARGKA